MFASTDDECRSTTAGSSERICARLKQKSKSVKLYRQVQQLLSDPYPDGENFVGGNAFQNSLWVQRQPPRLTLGAANRTGKGTGNLTRVLLGMTSSALNLLLCFERSTQILDEVLARSHNSSSGWFARRPLKPAVQFFWTGRDISSGSTNRHSFFSPPMHRRQGHTQEQSDGSPTTQFRYRRFGFGCSSQAGHPSRSKNGPENLEAWRLVPHQCPVFLALHPPS